MEIVIVLGVFVSFGLVCRYLCYPGRRTKHHTRVPSAPHPARPDKALRDKSRTTTPASNRHTGR